MEDVTKLGDFYQYYDTTMKRNIWSLGYFGGGSINCLDAYDAALQYAKIVNVDVSTVQIDEILRSSRYKHFKIIYSREKQEPVGDPMKLKNVYEFLTD